VANSSTNLDLINVNQSQKEVTANALFDAMSPNSLFGRRGSTSVGLTWGYYGGNVVVGGTPTQIANGTIALTANATNYVEADSSGVVHVNTSGWTGGYTRLYQVVTGASTVSSYTDWRVPSAGTVTSVGLSMPAEFTVSGSPVTSSGTLTATKATQSVNSVYAGPSSGGAAAPAFRALVQADLPAQPYDVGCTYAGAPTASFVLLRYPFPRQVVFPSGLTSSQGVAGTGATASTTFAIQKNGSPVGTMVFAAAATVATFTMSSPTTFAVGDVLTVVAPATPDATLANLGFSLAGTR
jgi:hypothetical protein